MKQFVLSDESLNSYGFKVLTRGINIDNFLQNPVMYYNHERFSGVIGRWESVKKKGSQLLGAPVFDEKDTLGAKIAGKVKDGFIKAASIGIDKVVIEQINGETIVTSCVLVECSVCDIPSNKNALMLYHDDKPVPSQKEFLKLYNNQAIMKTDLSPIIDALGLSQGASLNDIVTAIGLLKTSGGVNDLIDQAVKNNIVAKYERDELIQLANASPDAFKKYLQKRKELALTDREENGLKLINEAIRDGRVNADGNGKVKAFWLKSFSEDFESTKHALNQIPKRVSLKEVIEESYKSPENRGDWTLSDYRKKAPKELKNNPRLYQELLEKEKRNTNN